jgi:prepilin-type N-terminal cleavage/methylation domain-containing protein
MSRSGQANPSAGFTLLETLVVLVITSLISVVLVQGFGLVLAARTSVQNKLVDLDQTVLTQNVFLDPLRGILPDYPDRPNIFAGDARRLHGLTIHALESRAGAPVPFSMWLDFDAGTNQTILSYQEQGRPAIALGHWDGNQGSFSYRDRTGAWNPAWPLPPPLGALAPQTPWLIRIEIGAGFPSTLVAAVDGPHQRPFRLMDSPIGAASRP